MLHNTSVKSKILLFIDNKLKRMQMLQIVATNTQVIAKTIFNNANDKKLVGKDTVQAKSFEIKNDSNDTQ